MTAVGTTPVPSLSASTATAVATVEPVARAHVVDAPRHDPEADPAIYAAALVRYLTETQADDTAAEMEPVLPFRQCAQQGAGRAESLVFVVGSERFAISLAAIDEAVELPELHTLPESSAIMLGVFNLRGRLVPIYSPAPALGVTLRRVGAALVMTAGDRRVALAVDDVDDVLTLDFAEVRPSPGGAEEDEMLLGVTHRDGELIAVVDAEALLAACLASVPSHTPEKL